MSIRLRRVNGLLVALCAARSVEKPGDVYLDDAVHHALTEKFSADFASEGYGTPFDGPLDELREQEESNNPNRVEWDKTFGESCSRHVPVTVPASTKTPATAHHCGIEKDAGLLARSTYWLDFHWTTYRNAVCQLRQHRREAGKDQGR